VRKSTKKIQKDWEHLTWIIRMQKNAELDPLPTLFHQIPYPLISHFSGLFLSSCPPGTAAIPYCLCWRILRLSEMNKGKLKLKF
jgi:hypothetical protein